jgi:hypothetical protein
VRRWRFGGKFMKSIHSNGFSTFKGLGNVGYGGS